MRTFSIGFHEPSYDEAPYAAAVAAHLGTDHTELYVGPEDSWRRDPALPRSSTSRSPTPSQIPTSLVCRLARGHVTVALSGDGGDELFAGYHRYFGQPSLWRRCGLPAAVRQAAEALRAGPRRASTPAVRPGGRARRAGRYRRARCTLDVFVARRAHFAGFEERRGPAGPRRARAARIPWPSAGWPDVREPLRA